jgi:hypothetical protein
VTFVAHQRTKGQQRIKLMYSFTASIVRTGRLPRRKCCFNSSHGRRLSSKTHIFMVGRASTKGKTLYYGDLFDGTVSKWHHRAFLHYPYEPCRSVVAGGSVLKSLASCSTVSAVCDINASMIWKHTSSLPLEPRQSRPQHQTASLEVGQLVHHHDFTHFTLTPLVSV